jgi:hypothetical protein
LIYENGTISTLPLDHFQRLCVFDDIDRVLTGLPEDIMDF